MKFRQLTHRRRVLKESIQSTNRAATILSVLHKPQHPIEADLADAIERIPLQPLSEINRLVVIAIVTGFGSGEGVHGVGEEFRAFVDHRLKLADVGE